MSCPEATLRWWLSGTQGSTSGKFKMLPLPVQDGCIYEPAKPPTRPAHQKSTSIHVMSEEKAVQAGIVCGGGNREKHRRRQ